MNIIPIYKTGGICTRQVYGHIRNTKIGHCGTLDKYAQGIILVLTGESNKLQTVIHNMQKSYYFEIFIGIDTETNDIFGKINNIIDKHVDTISVIRCAQSMRNITQQRAPKFSAKKIHGKPMYKYKEKHNLPNRFSNIKIHTINIVWHNYRKLGIYIKVTGGFYVRAFARDIGISLHTCICVTKIVRTHIGTFVASNAILA